MSQKPISALSDAPIYSLYEAENEGHAAFLWAVGDGTTCRLHLTIRNLRDYPIQVRIDPSTTFAPRNERYQQMAVIRPSKIRLEGMEICSVWVNTACLQAERLAPDSKLTQIAGFLKGLGFGTTEIQQIVEEDDDQVKTRLNDLDRMARALGYAPERIRQIREELDNRRQRESPIMIMGYELAPAPEKNARALRSITDALAEIDCHIARISSLAQQPVKHLIERYGHKRVIDELARRHSDLESFQATQYLANFDSGLASNVFRSSGSRFKPMDAYQMVEFDTKNDPRWEAAPRLNSLVAQYAIWAATDNYGLDEAVKRITISADQRRLIAAGVRTVLRRAHGPSGDGGGTWRLRSKTIRFAQSRIVRVAGRMLGI